MTSTFKSIITLGGSVYSFITVEAAPHVKTLSWVRCLRLKIFFNHFITSFLSTIILKLLVVPPGNAPGSDAYQAPVITFILRNDMAGPPCDDQGLQEPKSCVLPT